MIYFRVLPITSYRVPQHLSSINVMTKSWFLDFSISIFEPLRCLLGQNLGKSNVHIMFQLYIESQTISRCFGYFVIMFINKSHLGGDEKDYSQFDNFSIDLNFWEIWQLWSSSIFWETKAIHSLSNLQKPFWNKFFWFLCKLRNNYFSSFIL